ncbi:MAG: zinc-dependent peptidase [Vulcanimicrobiota bacterium]
MEIRGANFGMYDANYLKVTSREHAKSVKPNVFREVDDSVNKALQLTQDVVALSPEARELLYMLKKYGKDSDQVRKYLKDKDFKKLIYNFKELRDLVYEEEEEDEGDAAQGKKKKKKKKGEPAVPNEIKIMISSGTVGGNGTRKVMGWSPLREKLDKMIAVCENDSKRKILIQELEPLGEAIIQLVKAFGTRIIVLPRDKNLTQIRIKGMSLVAPGERSFDGRPWEGVRGIYDNSRRIIVIGEENIGHPRHSTARHEFAHAFDHTFSQKNNRRLPLSVQLWNLFRKDRGGLVSDYAATNPQEYFAECVESFFRQSGKDELFQKDPQMYQYLEKLFNGEMQL